MSLDTLYFIPLAIIFMSIVILFRAKKDNIEDAELRIAAIVTGCGAGMLLFLAVYAFDLVCKAFL